MPELDPFETRLAAAVGAFADRAATAVDAAEVVRRAAGPEHRVRILGGRPVPAFAWILLALLALLVGLLGGAALAGLWRRDLAVVTIPSPTPTPAATAVAKPVALVPTGVGVLISNSGSYTDLVVDGTGIAWLREDSGSIVRFDPATRSRRSWSVADDAAFASPRIVPARSGGVWLVGQRTLWWFDGERFRDVIETPADLAAGYAGDLTVATEASDGSLWAATSDGTVLHRNGSSWSSLVAPRANSDTCARPDANCYTSAIAVDTAGRVWIGWSMYPDPPGVGWVSRYDSSGWTVLDDGLTSNQVLSIAQLPDGSVWLATDDGFARFDGSSWADATAEFRNDRCTSSVTAALDGTAWCAGAGSSAGAVGVWRFDGRSWVSGGEAGGLPESGVGTVVPTNDGSYVGIAGDSLAIYELTDGRWARAWEPVPPGSQGPRFGDKWPSLLAISRDELWAIGEGGVWHYLDGAWTEESIDQAHPGGRVEDLALAPDGTLWAAGDDGVAYRRDGRWVVADADPAWVVTVERDGTAWVAGRGSRCDIWTLRSSGTAWTRTPLPACPAGYAAGGGVVSMAVDGRGTLWVGAMGFVVDGLASYSGGRWKTGDAFPGLPRTEQVNVLGTAPSGDPWIASNATDETGGRTTWAARFDGAAWTVIPVPDVINRNVVLAPDGALWKAGPARYDGQRWTFPYASRVGADDISVAPDGTVFVRAGNSSLWRFPAPAP